MVVTVLPLYLVSVGGFSPLAFGVIDGLYNGATAIVALASGFIGDRWRRHKEVAATGYGLSAICKLLLVGGRHRGVGDRRDRPARPRRQGHPHRAARRDDLALDAASDELGTAFGVHRAMDTTGAMLGPLVAFALLAIAPLAFDSVFLVSFLLRDRRRSRSSSCSCSREAGGGDAAEPAPAPSLRGAFGLLRDPALPRAPDRRRRAQPRDGERRVHLPRAEDELDLGTSLFPLLFVGSAGAFMVLAVPMGRLADRFGRGRASCSPATRCCSASTPCCCSRSAAGCSLIAALGLLGAYYAATDGVLMALGSAVVPGGGARQRAGAPAHRRRASPAWSPRSPSARCGRSGASTSRSPCSASRSWSRRPSPPSCSPWSPEPEPARCLAPAAGPPSSRCSSSLCVAGAIAAVVAGRGEGATAPAAAAARERLPQAPGRAPPSCSATSTAPASTTTARSASRRSGDAPGARSG